MGFELQVHPSLACVKTQQPLQTFHSLTFNDCHPKVRPCWRNMMDEGRDVENFHSEHHQLTSLERYLACQWTRVFSGDQCIVITLWPTYLPGCCILMLFFTYIHKIQVVSMQCFFIFLRKILLPPKDFFNDLNSFKFFEGKCSGQEKVRPTTA